MTVSLRIADDKVRKNTSSSNNDKIDQAIYDSVNYYIESSPKEIRRRLKKLDKEWNIEEVLRLNASILVLAGTALAVRKNKKWFALPAIVAAFFTQHLIQGWCPPLPILRAMGIRTADEIDAEKYALLELLRRKGH